MIAPTHVMVTACGLLTLAGFGAGLHPVISLFWQVSAGLVLGVSLIDLRLCFKRPTVTITRSIHHSLPVTAWTTVTVNVTNLEKRKLFFWLHDIHPSNLLTKGQPASIFLDPGQSAKNEYSLYPQKRGDFSLPGADLIIRSPLHLWRKKWFIPCLDEVKVFPNFREINHYTLLATHHRLSLMGIKKLLQRGEGKEFHQLREYRQGDELQKIDWKATSRHRKLISKEYQDERDQHVVFVLDSGRRMCHVESGKSHLDQALNSILLLAYVASRQGDGVGLYSFGGTRKWHPPRKEEDSVRALLLASYDIEPSDNSADYLRATQDLLAIQSRRALMIIISNSRSEDHDDLLQMARQLRKKHLVVIADLRESILDDSIRQPVANFEDALRYQALQHYLTQRKTLLKQLSHLGVLSLDVTADQLPVSIVNCYLEIKSSGCL